MKRERSRQQRIKEVEAQVKIGEAVASESLDTQCAVERTAREVIASVDSPRESSKAVIEYAEERGISRVEATDELYRISSNLWDENEIILIGNLERVLDNIKSTDHYKQEYMMEDLANTIVTRDPRKNRVFFRTLFKSGRLLKAAIAVLNELGWEVKKKTQ